MRIEIIKERGLKGKIKPYPHILITDSLKSYILSQLTIPNLLEENPLIYRWETVGEFTLLSWKNTTNS